MALSLTEQFIRTRKRGVPLIGIETPDPGATEAMLIGAMVRPDKTCPAVYRWDICKGLKPSNPAAVEDQKRNMRWDDAKQAESISPAAALDFVQLCGDFAAVFIYNAHRFYDDPQVAQAIWHLRDLFKSNNRTLVLMAPSIKLPIELERDVVVMEEPLPTEAQIGPIVETVYKQTGWVSTLKAEQKDEVVRASRGLSCFGVEQAISLALDVNTKSIDLESLWSVKRKMIEQTKGLQLYIGGETFDGIGGIDRAKSFGKQLFSGPEKPDAIVWIDEIDKALSASGGGAQTESSGTSADALGVILNAMADNKWHGMLLVGHPGCAKSLYAKSLAATHDRPCLKFDVNATKGKYVGESEAQIRQAIKTISAVAGGRAYWIATCNRLDSIPPELQRRFTDGIWFFDLPTEEERDPIWGISGKSQPKPVKTDKKLRPDDTDWTGSDIASCCSIAYRLGIPLQEAAKYLTPVAKSDPRRIERLRRVANGAFLDASHEGTYRHISLAEHEAPEPAKKSGERKMEL